MSVMNALSGRWLLTTTLALATLALTFLL